MRLLEFFNEAQVELKSPTTLQKVLDEFLSFTASADQLPPELEAAEMRISVIRSRLEQSNLPGMTKAGKSPGKFGTIPLDDEDMRAIAFAVKTVATSQDAMKLQQDLGGMPNEGLSVNGAEGLGGHGDGFEIQNQGVTRRSPGEGPKVNGGRSQLRTMDSYDQPQYKANEAGGATDITSAVLGAIDAEEQDDFIDAMGGLENVPTGQGMFDPNRTQGTSGYDFTQDNEKLVNMLGLTKEEFMGVRDPQGFDRQDNAIGTQEVGEAVDEDRLYWKETSKDMQFEAETDMGKFIVHTNPSFGGKWAYVFYPAEGLDVPYADGYAKTSTQAKMYAQEAYENILKNPPESTAAGATATAPMGSIFKGRQLVNSLDKTKLKKSSEKEQDEHPWASKKVATKIAKDHMKLGEEKLTLKEFFSYKEED
jgi:hypothetical protein